MIPVLHLIEWGDTSGLFTHMAEHHDRSRYDVRFMTLKKVDPQFQKALAKLGTPVESLDCLSRVEYPGAILRLMKYLRREGIVVLHTHLFDPSFVGLVAGKLSPTKALVRTRHYSNYHTRIDKRIHVNIDRFCTLLADRVIAVSEHTRKVMLEEERAPSEKVVTVLNGVAPSRVPEPSPEEVERLRSELGLDMGTSLLMPARLHPEKGHEYAFQAIAQLRDGGSKVRLFLAGMGPFEDAYRERVAELGISDAVKFLGFRRDIIALMRSVDAVILPSVAEAFGLVAVEAIAAGALVIASDVGGLPEIIQDGVNGLLVKPGSAESLANTISELMSNPSLRARLRANVGRAILERFGFRDMVRSYESVYEELLQRG